MAGEIKPKKPNNIQRFIHRIVQIQSVSMFFATRLHRIDFFLLKLTRGRFTLSEFGGWTIIVLKTVGAKSGEERILPLVATLDGKNIGLIATSFGRRNNPAWYYNLKVNPDCHVIYKGQTRRYHAKELEGLEYEKFWQLAGSVYSGYESYKQRAAHRHIPIMVLEPIGDQLDSITLHPHGL